LVTWLISLGKKRKNTEDKIVLSIENTGYPVTRLASLPVIRYKKQDKTVGQASRLSIKAL